MTLFAVAGALQGTHVSLEMRTGGDCLAADKRLPFEKRFWAAPLPHAQPGLVALAATLTKLEVCTQQDIHLRSRMCWVAHYLQVQTCCTACCAGQLEIISPKTGQLALPMLAYTFGGGNTVAGGLSEGHRGGERYVGGVKGPACTEAFEDWVRLHVSSKCVPRVGHNEHGRCLWQGAVGILCKWAPCCADTAPPACAVRMHGAQKPL
jgi:hypothetical protein